MVSVDLLEDFVRDQRVHVDLHNYNYKYRFMLVK